SPGFISRRLGLDDITQLEGEAFWRAYVDFWMGLGFDCVPMEIPLRCPLPEGHHATSEESEAKVCIRNREDFERYPWPDPADPFDLAPFEIVAGLLPEGARIVGGVMMGPYEWVSTMMGTVGLSYALADDPDLVRDVFATVGALHVGADRLLAGMDAVGALRQGDDLGFKTSTFLPPALLREHVFPTYRRMAEAAHAADKPFILHSCGNLGDVYDDLIDDCGIDAKHSFEDQILPVEQFKAQYGDRVTPLGGLDVDVICRADEAELRAYTRRHIEACFARDGHWALGTGNSLTNYMPVENYLVVLEEGMAATA
ncbi:MAG: uroporphyrinogen decarboxylase family protein, partial [Planctomycetota bacterium]